MAVRKRHKYGKHKNYRIYTYQTFIKVEFPQLYESITVPETVVKDLEVGGLIIVPNVKKLSWVNILPDIRDEQEKFLYNLDEGERQVIIHGLSAKVELVIIDEILRERSHPIWV